MNDKLRSKIIIIALVPIIFILNIIAKGYPEFIEKYYSTGLDRPIREGLSIITGVFPFSAAEFLVIIFVIILVMSFIVLIIKIVKGGFIKQLINALVFASCLYIIFMVFWGFNYNRVSFDKIAKLKIEKSSKEDLYKLCESLIERANTLRSKVYQNPQGVMTIKGGYKDVFKREALGYEAASKIYPELGGNYGPPKRILLSEKMSYTGITGIYMPYTGEPNVNINVTDYMLPATAAHEMAHQRGFAREDEANYIAYVTCSMHPNYDFQYSGIMLAVIYSMNALADNDIESYKQLAKTYSEGVRRDLIYDSEYWQKYKGKTEKITNQVNNTYLKSNGQKDGVQSYGRMVDLLIAEYKKK